jgi:hypothetical protein
VISRYRGARLRSMDMFAFPPNSKITIGTKPASDHLRFRLLLITREN